MKKNKKTWDDVADEYDTLPGFKPNQKEDDELHTYLFVNKKLGIISSVQARDGDHACIIFNQVDPLDREDWTIAVELGDQPTTKDYH